MPRLSHAAGRPMPVRVRGCALPFVLRTRSPSESVAPDEGPSQGCQRCQLPVPVHCPTEVDSDGAPSPLDPEGACCSQAVRLEHRPRARVSRALRRTWAPWGAGPERGHTESPAAYSRVTNERGRCAGPHGSLRGRPGRRSAVGGRRSTVGGPGAAACRDRGVRRCGRECARRDTVPYGACGNSPDWLYAEQVRLPAGGPGPFTAAYDMGRAGCSAALRLALGLVRGGGCGQSQSLRRWAGPVPAVDSGRNRARDTTGVRYHTHEEPRMSCRECSTESPVE